MLAENCADFWRLVAKKWSLQLNTHIPAGNKLKRINLLSFLNAFWHQCPRKSSWERLLPMLKNTRRLYDHGNSELHQTSSIVAATSCPQSDHLLLACIMPKLFWGSLMALAFCGTYISPLGWHQAAGTSSCWNIDWFYVDKRLTPSCTSARVFEDEWDVVLVKTKRLHGEVLTHLLFMLFSDVNTRIIRIQTNSNISRSVNKRGSPFQSWLSRSGWTRGWDCDASNDLQVLQKAHKSVFPGKPRTQYILWTHGALMCLVFLQGWWNIVKWTT